MNKYLAIMVVPLLVSCAHPLPNAGAVPSVDGKVEVWVVGARRPIGTWELEPAFAKALLAREGKRTSAGYSVLTDEEEDERIGRVVFSISGREYLYPIMKCPVPVNGSARFVWHGPQNDMRFQTKTRDGLFLCLGECLRGKSPNKPTGGDVQ